MNQKTFQNRALFESTKKDLWKPIFDKDISDTGPVALNAESAMITLS